MPTEDELVELLPGIDGWLAGVERISARVLDAATSLRVISRNGVGADAVDTASAHAKGIAIVLARGANSRGVAELAITLTLASLRDLPNSNRVMHEGGWQRTLGREMPDITLGIVGFGAIGRLVAQLGSALGADILAYDPFSPVESGSGATSATLAELFASSDVITLHSPPSDDGSPLVTHELLALVRRGSVLINTARSALVHDDAVLDALQSGQLKTYAVDAFDLEPPVLTAVLNHANTILTPHLGGYTGASTRRASELAVSNLLATLGE
ncbi:NAD(P)-dependent oxidoreductase [Cryobacterium sp. PH31-O1]|uniref:NAD(P)-dependent oxidoreductase n=1 Tax=Cryobacterium sp. PH31-O1 TaxID=3046306 RepID=UPI0024BAD041|nr:NAD(P)-dependent oxidoreductase [Cryobacterium sp. PH31-O1]MDJ0336686.1 NAD(P)-dependent oxidoreductase [Cryobacterium sp. PH31-O1]